MMNQMMGRAPGHEQGYVASTLAGLLLCCMLAGCSHGQPAASASSTAPSATSSSPASTTAPAAAVQAYLDPVTGQWREPTATELAAIEKARKQALSISSPSAAQSSVTVTPLANGVTRYDLSTRARIHETACLDAHGQLGPCTPAQRTQLEQGSQTP